MSRFRRGAPFRTFQVAERSRILLAHRLLKGSRMTRFLRVLPLAAAAFFSLATSMAGPWVDVTITPLDGETNVPAEVRIRLEVFQDPADEDFEIQIQLIGDAGEILFTQVEDEAGIDIIPAAPLGPGDYRIEVETKVGDVFASTFATYSDPRVRSAGPAGGTLQRFRISFSQDMDPETLTANTLRVFDDGAETPAVISWKAAPVTSSSSPSATRRRAARTWSCCSAKESPPRTEPRWRTCRARWC